MTFPAVPVASLRFGDASADDMKIFNVTDVSRQGCISRVNITTVLSSGLQVSSRCHRHLTFRIPRDLNTSCFSSDRWSMLSHLRPVCFSAVVVLPTPDNYSIPLLRQITAISLQTVIMGLNPCEWPLSK